MTDVEMSSPEDEGPAHGGNQSAAGEADNQERPSEYLRSRCPLCFGGKDWKKTEDLCAHFLGFLQQYS